MKFNNFHDIDTYVKANSEETILHQGIIKIL